MNLYSKLITSLTLPCVTLLTESKFWSLYRRFSKNGASTVFILSEDRQFLELQRIVDFALANVPFYRQHYQTSLAKFERLETIRDFAVLPSIVKSDIAGNFPDRITSARKIHTPWRYVSTSGTTERLTAVQDFQKRDYVRAAALLALCVTTSYKPGMKYLEIPPDICTDICGASETLEPGLLSFVFTNLKAGTLADKAVVSDIKGLIERRIIYRRLQLPSFGAEGLSQKAEILEQYLRQIDEYEPFVVKALPVYLYLLALHILENGLKPPRISGGIMPMGSSLTPYMKQVVEQAFQTLVHEDYGCAELGSIAAECGHQQGLHPFNSLFYVEVVRDGRPAEYGEPGKVLITDFNNYAMPFIRYDIGDVAVRRNGTCKCGLNTDRIEIQGRVQDCLVAPDGAILTHDVVVDEMLKLPDILGFQMELNDPEQLYVRVVGRGEAKPDLNRVKEKAKQLLGAKVTITAQVVSTISPEPGGKYRFVKNNTRAVKDLF